MLRTGGSAFGRSSRRGEPRARGDISGFARQRLRPAAQFVIEQKVLKYYGRLRLSATRDIRTPSLATATPTSPSPPRGTVALGVPRRDRCCQFADGALSALLARDERRDRSGSTATRYSDLGIGARPQPRRSYSRRSLARAFKRVNVAFATSSGYPRLCPRSNLISSLCCRSLPLDLQRGPWSGGRAQPRATTRRRRVKLAAKIVDLVLPPTGDPRRGSSTGTAACRLSAPHHHSNGACGADSAADDPYPTATVPGRRGRGTEGATSVNRASVACRGVRHLAQRRRLSSVGTYRNHCSASSRQGRHPVLLGAAGRIMFDSQQHETLFKPPKYRRLASLAVCIRGQVSVRPRRT